MSDTTSAGVTVRPNSAEMEVTPASLIPQGTICWKGARSLLQLTAKPCIVTRSLTLMPIAAILRAGRPSAAASHTPDRPSILVPSMPNVPREAMMTSSRVETYSATRAGSRSARTGYPTSCPGPCQVSFPPRSTGTTGVPSKGRSWSSVRLPAV